MDVVYTAKAECFYRRLLGCVFEREARRKTSSYRILVSCVR